MTAKSLKSVPSAKTAKAGRVLRGVRVILRAKRMEDAEKDYIWRSDPEIARLDAAYPITMKYDRYLKHFEDQLRMPTPGSGHFGIEVAGGKYIGNCMYYDLDSISKEAELGVVIGDKDYWSGGYGYDVVVTLLRYMFEDLGLQRVYLHTLDWNHRARKCFERSGFSAVKSVKRMTHNFILMETRRADWDAAAPELLAQQQRYLDQHGGVPIADGDATAAARASAAA